MRMSLCHSGDVRQYVLDPGDQEEPSARLHVPLIQLPKDTEETQLHGDIEGSPYSRNPGRISLDEAAEEAAARDAPKGRSKPDEPERVRSQPGGPSGSTSRSSPDKKD